MNNPFDDDDAQFYVLINDEGEHSMWPIFATVPGGWRIAYGAATRTACLDYVETHWLDMRPNSLIAAMHPESN
ncbi:MbtH family protein [Nocardia australiensis]|uniref:MbtH family protein n=1 Tax=Nocardia australiensis TaxID=2887191 RepID=UPI001D14E01E|nr:MbtH family protein [Nocardia australiensis]